MSASCLHCLRAFPGQALDFISSCAAHGRDLVPLSHYYF